MIVGHYAAGLVAKSVDRRIPLWLLFLAANAVDFAWAALLLLGVEKARVVPGITAADPLDLYFIPYSHGLASSLLLFGIVVLAFGLLRRVGGLGGWRIGLVVGVTALSHWFLDLITHRPDLPLLGNLYKVGLGLWHYQVASYVVEAAWVAFAVWLYYRGSRTAGADRRYGIAILGAVLIATQAAFTFGPPPPSVASAAILNLLGYALLVFVAFRLERGRMATSSAGMSP
ncbi:MAG TPA: hypothetical protein VF902_09105 [Coriobacteriia bacterium]